MLRGILLTSRLMGQHVSSSDMNFWGASEIDTFFGKATHKQ